MRSLSCKFVPIAGAITPFLDHSSSLSALSPYHVSPTTPCTSRPATARSYAADTAAPSTCRQATFHHLHHHCILYFTRPCLNLETTWSSPRVARWLRIYHVHAPTELLLGSLCTLLSCRHQTYYCIPCNHSRATRFLPIYSMSFHPLRPPASAQGLSQFDTPTSKWKVHCCQ